MPSLSTTLTASTAGSASAAIDVDLLFSITDWTIYLEGKLTENVAALLSVHDSCDSFVNDIHTIMVWCPQAGSGLINHVTAPNPLRKYECPLGRVGITGAKIRLYLQDIGGIAPGSVVAKLTLELNKVEY